ncbi:hypothetical protein CDAR_573751 [Caerostris darwini]|uniref:Uncharacterized protein n=1 Tax=Caerostris darwini TaxID=1538125 RepID=A0AAV4MD79_9ARAC|nr:hypothetical protein CDAR_573751 [Caerostris darwini]
MAGYIATGVLEHEGQTIFYLGLDDVRKSGTPVPSQNVGEWGINLDFELFFTYVRSLYQLWFVYRKHVRNASAEWNIAAMPPVAYSHCQFQKFEFFFFFNCVPRT